MIARTKRMIRRVPGAADGRCRFTFVEVLTMCPTVVRPHSGRPEYLEDSIMETFASVSSKRPTDQRAGLTGASRYAGRGPKGEETRHPHCLPATECAMRSLRPCAAEVGETHGARHERTSGPHRVSPPESGETSYGSREIKGPVPGGAGASSPRTMADSLAVPSLI